MAPSDMSDPPTLPDSKLEEEVACDRSSDGSPTVVASASGD